MENFEKIDSNIQKMLDQGASDDEVKLYLDYEGVTPGEVADAKPESVGRTIARSIQGAVDTAKGRQDPRFADVPGFNFQGITDPGTASQIQMGKSVTFEDKSYGDIVKSALGERVTNIETDAEGYEILTYKGDDGQEHRTYVNKPGLDYGDVDRLVSGALPFVAAGGAAAVGARVAGAGLTGRMALQGAGQGAASIASDVGAQQIGSEQPVDVPRAAIAAAGGTIMEGLSGPIVTAWRKIFGRGGIDKKTGQLTSEAREQALSIGLDPDDMDQRLTMQFAEEAPTAASEAELGAKYRTGEFDIRTTEGQRTKRPDVLGSEEEMRRGLMGQDAQDVMRGFDKDQAADIERAVQGRVAKEIAPERAGIEPATLGERIHTGAEAQRAAARETESEIWEAVGPAFPKEEAMEMLPATLAGRLQKAEVSPDLDPTNSQTPSAKRMTEMLERYWKGEAMAPSSPVLGQVEGAGEITIDGMRRKLLTLQQGAEAGSTDKKVSTALYNGFNTWIDDIAEKAAIEGAPDVAAKLTAARAFTRDMRELFEPRRGGKLTPQGKKLQGIFESGDTPENVVNVMFGRGGPTTAPSRGTIETLQHMKRILRDKEPDAWNDIRLAYWVKIAQDNKGRVLSPVRLRDAIDAAFHNQKSTLRVLYSDRERDLMKRLSTALEDVTSKPPNVSGTSYELERLRRKYSGDNAAKTVLRTLQTRATFSKHDFFMARVYQLLAKKLPVSVFSSREGAGRALATRATSDQINRRLPPSLGHVGGAVGAQVDEE